jgi:hypothetical protein
MRGALLFLTTILLITPRGRENISGVMERTSTFYAAGAPYTAMMLWLTAGMALIVLLMLRRRKPAERQVIVIRWESGAPAPESSVPRRKKARLAWVLRIVPFIKRFSWA